MQETEMQETEMQETEMQETEMQNDQAVSGEFARRGRSAERGAGVVEWLGISALSIGMLVVLFAAMETLGLDVINQIRGSLGL